MSYAESLERLRNFQKRPDGVVTKVPEPPFDTFDTAAGRRFQNSPPGGSDPAAEGLPSKLALRAALADACEGLPLTVSELEREYGEEGANDYAEGQHHTPEYLRAFAVAVAERLEIDPRDFQKRPSRAVTKVPEGAFETFDTARGRRFQNSSFPDGMFPGEIVTTDSYPDSGLITPEPSAPTANTAAPDGPENEKGDFQKRASRAVPKVPKAPHPLEGLPLLREDWAFIECRTQGRRDRDALMEEYGARWRAAADAEPVAFRRANRGRFAGNTWLAEATGRRLQNPRADARKHESEVMR